MPEQQMSESYHRARRMFALLSGILIAWEYIGINIGGDRVNNHQSVTGITPGIGLPVTIRNPEIIPTIIFILVLYFSFRFTIEWTHSPIKIRHHLTSLIDVVVAYLIGLAAVILFAVQRMTQVRLADFFGIQAAIGASIGFFAVIVLIVFRHALIPEKKINPIIEVIVTAVLSIVLMVVLFGLLTPIPILLRASLAGSILAILPRSLYIYINYRSYLREKNLL